MRKLISIYKILIKLFSNPQKTIRYISLALKCRISKKDGVLVIIGVAPFGEFDIIHPKYSKSYVFEAHPERYASLLNKYGSNKHIVIIHAAVSDYDGKVELNMSNNNGGASSSLGTFRDSWADSRNVKMVDKVEVPSINLYNYLKKNGIDYIDEYISDIQGMDLQVLKTLKPMIEQKKIGTIKCEVTQNKFGNIYKDLPDNSENGFHELLKNNYILIAKGSGVLVEGRYENIPENSWEMDCKWKRKA